MNALVSFFVIENVTKISYLRQNYKGGQYGEIRVFRIIIDDRFSRMYRRNEFKR